MINQKNENRNTARFLAIFLFYLFYFKEKVTSQAENFSARAKLGWDSSLNWICVWNLYLKRDSNKNV